MNHYLCFTLIQIFLLHIIPPVLSQNEPKIYNAVFTTVPLKIDGKIDSAWDQAAWSDPFVDIEGPEHEIPTWETKVKMMWDQESLYILAWLEEPHVWAYLNNRDAIIYHDNDFEVFIKPDRNRKHYFEYEINANNTLLDLLMTKPYSEGGLAFITWDSKNVKHAVNVKGTLNNPGDTDQGWWVEMMIPYKDLVHYGARIRPKEGEFWRINFSRVEWKTKIDQGKYVKKKGTGGRTLPEMNWVWTPQYTINMHIPRHWGKVVFKK